MKTVFVSEITGKSYDTEQECIKAEEEATKKLEAEKKALAEKKAKEDTLKAERKERANEVEEAFKHYENKVKELNAKRVSAYQDYKKLCADLDKEEQKYRNGCTEILNQFVNDYGQFNMSLKSTQQIPFMIRPFFNFFDSFFDF